MHISRFQLLNYKSFRDSGILEFQPGINIIVGANNSGKTALLEALSLSFETSPHRSIETLPQPNSTLSRESSAKLTLIFTKAEIHNLFDDLPVNHYVGLSSARNSHLGTDEVLALFQKWMDDLSDVELTISKSTGSSVGRNDISIKGLDPAIKLTYYRPDRSPIGSSINRNKNILKKDGSGRFIFYQETNEIDSSYTEEDFFVTLFHEFRNNISQLQAQRFVGNCSVGNDEELNSRASNLAEVIHLLESRGKEELYERFNDYVSTMFPQFASVSTQILSKQHSREPNPVEILLWPAKATESNRKDLAFSLSDCGTGTGQVLAILYAVLASPEPRPIIIDEPQSYLHPGAVKKLIQILKEFPQHQYFIATHSAQIIAAANPSTIVKLRYEDGYTIASTMNARDIREQRSLLAELGVSLSDVFGADAILWVEGPTEERCFPLVLDKLAPKLLTGTKIVSIKNTGDLLGKKAHFADVMFDLYQRLSGGNNLYPPAVGFVFDKECLSKSDIEALERRKPHPLKFIKRRMYENYLLHPDAIAAVLDREDAGREQPLADGEVREWLETNKSNRDYFPKLSTQKELSNSQWVDKNINAAKLLDVLFAKFSEARVEFRKTKHSVMLTEWLLENDPDYFAELVQFLRGILDAGKAAVS